MQDLPQRRASVAELADFELFGLDYLCQLDVTDTDGADSNALKLRHWWEALKLPTMHMALYRHIGRFSGSLSTRGNDNLRQYCAIAFAAVLGRIRRPSQRDVVIRLLQDGLSQVFYFT